MHNPTWRSDPVFGQLRDLVASDQLVVLTGAGISRALPRQNDPSRRVPDWTELLRDLYLIFQSALSREDREDCERLLNLLPSSASETPAGKALIAAASILRQVDPVRFDRELESNVSPAPGSSSPTHNAILDLEPRGVLTFNYDAAHEAAADARGFRFEILLPDDEVSLRHALSERLIHRFLLKAHGSLGAVGGLVLTAESYRRLLVLSPAYRAFVQHLLTNFHLLVVGFRLSDPDFDLFLDTLFRQFGSPLHKHVAIFKSDDRSSSEILLRRQYGIHTLFVDDHGVIPDLLGDAAGGAGPRLHETIERCFAQQPEERSRGHRELARLGSAGKRCAGAELISRLGIAEKAGDFWKMSEAAFSLGRMDAQTYREELLRVVETSPHVDPVARALTVLREVLTLDDLPRLSAIRARASMLAGTNSKRALAYLDYLEIYLPSKFASDPPVSAEP